MPTTTDQRLALIDAEILRCRAEMQRELVQREGRFNLTAMRGRRKSRDRDESDGAERNTLRWKERLSRVHALLKSIKQEGIAERLFRNVMRHLHETIPELERLDVLQPRQWKALIEILVDSRDYYTDKADTLSFFMGKSSPFYLFEAVAQGLSFNAEEALSSDLSGDVREAWLEQLLGNVGLKIKELNQQPGYFEKAIGNGSGAIFSEIANALQGIDSGHVLHKPMDWRNALKMVMNHVEQIGQPDDPFLRAVYENVKTRLEKTVRKLVGMSENDLKTPENWERLYDVLRERMISFDTLSLLPVVADLFRALSTGMERALGKRSDWMQRRGNGDRAIELVLNSLGTELEKLKADYYNQFLPSGGARHMAAIAHILSKAGKK